MRNLLSVFDLGAAEDAVVHAARVAVILLLAWLLQRVAARILQAFRDYMARRAHEDLTRIRTLESVLRRLATVIITVVAGTLVLAELGISVVPILATAGVAGIAVGFGAQSLIKDYFNGFFLLVEDQLRQGDFVEIAGRTGIVEDLTLRHVRLRDLDGYVYYVPNSEIKVVQNRTRGYVYAVADVAVKSSQRLEDAYAAMSETGDALRADAELGPQILAPVEIAGVERWEPWGLVLRSRIKVLPNRQWAVRAEYIRRVKQAFEAKGIQTP